MSILADLRAVLSLTGIPVETGVFSETPPEQYIVIVPMAGTFELHADNAPGVDVQEARISIYSQGSYTAAKDAAVRALLSCDFTITARQYIGYEPDTGYHHYNIDAAKYYEWS